jgi:hypothetical protein
MVAKNENEELVVTMMGSGNSAFGGSPESELEGWFCVGIFVRNLASVTIKMFSYFLYFIHFVLSIQFSKTVVK